MAHRVAIVTGIPAPYREPVFAELAGRPGIDLNVYYCAAGHDNVAWSTADRRSDYPHEFLPNLAPGPLRRLPMVGYMNLSLTARLRTFRPDVVIVYGYNQVAHWLAFQHCRRHGIPLLLRSDSNVRIDQSTTWRSNVRRRLLRGLVKRTDGFLTVGSANAEYWQRHGARPDQIFSAPFAIDNDKVMSLVGERTPSTDGSLRILYAGRLVPRKGVDLLIDAFNELEATGRARLTIVGDGPERESLQAQQTPAAAWKTTWTGKLTNDDVFRRFADADLFVLPSRYEPWGLVVNEAMAAGLPVIASKECGAAIDLIEEGRTGWFCDPLNAATLTTLLRQCVDDPTIVHEAGNQARRKVQDWSFRRTVDGFVNAIEANNKPVAQVSDLCIK